MNFPNLLLVLIINFLTGFGFGFGFDFCFLAGFTFGNLILIFILDGHVCERLIYLVGGGYRIN